ncbi:MAG: hypothetical protein HZC55_08690 [Verrucomicrobia bacterium]|nr:hypothetical protein [Verrucomicrobiota bacterium]
MRLSDREILELNELCGALADGRATEAQRRQLESLLRDSEAARRFYVRAAAQSASLHAYAAEMQADAPLEPGRRGVRDRLPAWVGGAALPFAAVLVAGAYLMIRGPGAAPKPADGGAEVVARLTGAKDAVWVARGTATAPGTSLRRGQQLELKSGYAEVTFDSGARLLLEGATALDLGSAWEATLRRGTVKAEVPPEAIGFRIAHRFVDVVDLGTEFTLFADADRGAEVLVNRGAVEAAPREGGEADSILLREREGRRFGADGISEVADRARKLERFADLMPLERFVPGVRLVHWSFDEPDGAARGEGALAVEPWLRLLGPDGAGDAGSRVRGRRGQALHFDGRRYAKAAVPGLSGGQPRTVAFWVRVPEDAPPADTWMVAWGTQLPKLGRRPVHIGWNRRPGEGALGALRTDFGGGHALGTTSLRDGQWHHVAVCFTAGEEAGLPVEVKQYVDGRLESSTIVRGVLSPRAGTGDATLSDVLWLGYRLTGNRQEGRRFLGQIDELFVADRALQPHEIVALMRENRLPAATLAAAPSRP